MLLSPSELSQIAREVAPRIGDGDAGVYGVWERAGDSVPGGGGFRRSPGGLIGQYAGRIRYAGDLSPEQKTQMGLGLVEADYILKLEPGGWARPGHIIRQIPDLWKANKFEVTGTVKQATYAGTVPVTPLFYRAVQNGQSGLAEPLWGTVTGSYTVDGTLKWRCEGLVVSYSVMAELGPSTYGDYLGRSYALQTNQDQR